MEQAPSFQGSRGAVAARTTPLKKRRYPSGPHPTVKFISRAKANERFRAAIVARRLPTVSYSYKTLKRLVDLIACILFLPVILGLLVVVGVAVILTSGFPVLYRQQRIGQYGKPFTIYKFRTMRNGSADLLADWFKHNPEAHAEWRLTHKLRHDPRITRGGRFLRQTSLDELPQIINVLRGDMSLVGPRPVVEAELVRYGKRVVFYSAAVPGVTGLWQVSGRCNITYHERVRIDERYVRQWTLLQDLAILLRTPRAVLRRDGAC